jgi:phosphoketolase
LPDFRAYAIVVPELEAVVEEATRVLGGFLRDVMKENLAGRNFRMFGPDETDSNRLNALFEVTERAWMTETLPEDDHLSPDGRVMEILSEHTCQEWLEGYLLTGRHGLFASYEAFIHVVDSMFNQHAKWLKTTSKEIPWRAQEEVESAIAGYVGAQRQVAFLAGSVAAAARVVELAEFQYREGVADYVGGSPLSSSWSVSKTASSPREGWSS